MKTRNLLPLLAAAVMLSGCGMLKQKAAEYYLGRARKTAAAQNPPPAAIEAAFTDIELAFSYAPDSRQAVTLLEDLAEAASRNGFAKAQELEAGALKKALAANPSNWAAREALINFFAARGDTAGLEAMAAQAQELAASGDAKNRYCALLAALAARASALPWLESEGYLALNKTPEVFFEKTAAYSAAAEKIPALKAETEKLAAADPSLKKAAPVELVSAAEVAAADALRDSAAVSRVVLFSSRTASDQAFRKAVESTVLGNAALIRRDYPQARAFYQGALNNYPGLLDAARQIAEADFQEGAGMAATGGDQKAAARLLYKAYGGVSGAITEALKSGNVLPFIKPDKFLGELYSLKAADLAALRAVEGKRLRNTARLQSEFKAALDEALKLNPEGRLAREMLDRYNKEGF